MAAPPGLAPPPGLGGGGGGGGGNSSGGAPQPISASAPPPPPGLSPSQGPLGIYATGSLGGNHQTTQQQQQMGHHGGGGGGGGGAQSAQGISTIVKAQIVFLLSTLTEESWERNVAEIRTLVSQNSPEMYHHFLRRLIVVTSPVLQSLQQQASSVLASQPNSSGGGGAGAGASDRPLPTSQPLSIPPNGAGVLAWRVLEAEARRASKDPALAPHFAITLLVALPPASSPPLQLNLLQGFKTQHFFALACNALLSPHLVTPDSALADRSARIIAEQLPFVVSVLEQGNASPPFWNEPTGEDLTPEQARALVLAQYPIEGLDIHARRPSLPLGSLERQRLLQALTTKFASPAIVLQCLSALAPGSSNSAAANAQITLAEILMELGEGLTSDEGIVAMTAQKWWRDWSSLTEQAAQTISSLIAGSEQGRQVDVQGVVTGLTSLNIVDWSQVLQALDRPDSALHTPSAKTWVYPLVVASPQPPHAAVDGVFPSATASVWQHVDVQLALLDALLSGPINLTLFPSMQHLVSLADIADLPPQVQETSRPLLSGTWNCKQLIDALRGIGARLEENASAHRVWESIMDRAMQIAPELILIGFAQSPKPWPAAHEQLVARLLADFADGRPNSPLVFAVLGKDHPDLILQALKTSYDANEMNVTKIVDAGQYASVLDRLLTTDNFPLALDVAAVASRKDMIDLESWISHSVEAHGSDFVHAALEFLDTKIHAESGASEEPTETVPLTSAVFATFFRALRQSNALEEEDVIHFKEIRNYCLQIYPRLMNLDPQAKQEPGLRVVTYPAEIEAQVEEFYQRMFKEYISLDQVVNEFKRLKASESTADQQLFGCMLHTLFDEYKFVAMYPHRQLAMAGILFGSIIQNRLIEKTPLHVAVRYVLDALQTPPELAMFTFGKDALKIFLPRLHDFPHMCQALLDIPHLHDSEPQLVTAIKAALADRRDTEDDEEPIVFSAIRVDDLDDSPDNEVNEPNENLSDKMLFVVNNLAPINFDDKMKEMRNYFSPKWSRWFANYLVNTRVAVEPNNHELYEKLMKELATPVFDKHVVHETLVRAFDLLNTSKTLNDTQERKVLDNLGAWLGRLTVAKDLPIRHRQLAVKDLLLEGYAAKRLKLAIPFTCQIMRQCSKSRVFRPPNPWVMAVLRVLVELYYFGDLSLQLKFEIERVCKALEIDVVDIEPAQLVRASLPTEAQGGLAQELERFTAPAELPAHAEDSADDTATAQNAYLRRVEELVSQLPEKTNFGPAHAMFQSNATLKRIVLHSIDRAVRDLINPVVERSVTIAGISSRDLLLKDFGMEGDENKLRQAAHLMVSKLAGSLALVSCKEPLRTSMTKTMREMMLNSGFTEETLPEQAISDVVGANLEVACSIIKLAAQEKAINDIDVNLAKPYAQRRQLRESSQAFYQPSTFTALVSRSALPDMLRLHPAGLQPSQLRVYEDFSEHSRFFAGGAGEGEYHQMPLQYATTPAPADRSAAASIPYPTSRPGSVPLGEVVESSILGSKTTVSQSMEKFQEMISELVAFISQTAAESLQILPLHHDIKMIIRQVPVVATQSINPDQSALAFSQKIVQLLYRSDGNLGREVFVTILQRLCDLFPKVAKEVTQWLVYAEDVRKFNVPVTIALLRVGLVRANELDAQLAKIVMRDFAQPAVTFGSNLLREAVLVESPVAERQQFAQTIEALAAAAAAQPGKESLERVLEDLQVGGGSVRSNEVDRSEGGAQLDSSSLGIYFLEWVRLFTSSLPVEASFVPFVNRLQKQGVLKGEEISSAFYRTSISLAIEMYSTHRASGSPQMFHGVDALSKLIALLLRNYSDTHGVSSDSAKTLYFAKIFTIAALSLVRDHEEKGAAFEQRPYFRFFSSLLSDLQSIQASFPQAYHGCLRTFANHLGSIQPAIVPSFAYSWMALISHRYFMPRLLQTANKEGWADFYRVLMALFKFLNPFLSASALHQPSRILFRGALRILLVILKDFPEFLVEHYIGLCAAIPAHCIQLRNVVLCAFPRGMALRPEIESLSELPPLPEFHVVPEIRTDYARFLVEAKIRDAIDSYTRFNQPELAVILPEVRSRVAISVSSADGTPSVTYNLTLLYSLTLYLGSSAVQRSIDQRGQVIFDPQAPEVLLLTSLAASLDGEGQHNLINSVVNQLRFPSAHTFFFMLYILHLFTSAPRDGQIPERITRVLLERVIAQRPHPWGLTTTFSELLHNEKLGFWTFPWVRAEPELFSIFNRCLGKQQQQQQV